jgi:hypothetical protein
MMRLATSRRLDQTSLLQGHDLLQGSADVIVCDSLSGNLIVKLLASFSTSSGKKEVDGYGYGVGVGPGMEGVVYTSSLVPPAHPLFLLPFRDFCASCSETLPNLSKTLSLGCIKQELPNCSEQRLVDNFNVNYAGKKDAGGRANPAITLPAHYDIGDYFFTQDLRLSRSFAVSGERYQLMLIGFNLFNRANLLGYDANLLNPATFGQPSSRVGPGLWLRRSTRIPTGCQSSLLSVRRPMGRMCNAGVIVEGRISRACPEDAIHLKFVSEARDEFRRKDLA